MSDMPSMDKTKAAARQPQPTGQAGTLVRSPSSTPGASTKSPAVIRGTQTTPK